MQRTFIAICLLLLIACHSKSKTTILQSETGKDSGVFFPLTDYFVQEMLEVDSAKTITLKIKKGTKTDSSLISKDALHTYINKFLSAAVQLNTGKNCITENVFHDDLTHSYTFNYSGHCDSLSLKNIDILLSDDSQKVKDVFITKSFTSSDSSITEKLGWTNNKSFYINRIVDYKDTSFTEQLNISWSH
jgi:hypothetical protein